MSCLQDIVSPSLACKKEQEAFWRLIKKVFPLSLKHNKDLIFAIRDLSFLLTQDRSAMHKPYWASPRFLSAYLYFFLPWNIYRFSWLLPSLQLDLKDGAKVLDLGSGPLTLPIALWLSRPDLRSKAIHFTCLDTSIQALSAGEKLFKELLGSVGHWTITLEKSAITTLHKPQKHYDLVMGANILNELKSPSQMRYADFLEQITKRFAALLNEQGKLLLLEPGTRLGGKIISQVRTTALQEGLEILSPCTHDKDCPMLSINEQFSSGWCHITFPASGVAKGLEHISIRSGIARDSLALSWMFSKKAPSEGGLINEEQDYEIESQTADLDELALLEKLYTELLEEDSSTELDDITSTTEKKVLHKKRLTSNLSKQELKKVFTVRVLSSSIYVPEEQGRSRYACSEFGLVRIRFAAAIESGSLVQVRFFLDAFSQQLIYDNKTKFPLCILASSLEENTRESAKKETMRVIQPRKNTQESKYKKILNESKERQKEEIKGKGEKESKEEKKRTKVGYRKIK